MGLNITVISYQERLDFGLHVDPDLVPDPWLLAEGIAEALAELLEASGLGEPTPVEDPLRRTKAVPKAGEIGPKARRASTPVSFNLSELFERVVDAVPDRVAIALPRPPPHLRRARRAGQPPGPPPRRPRAWGRATTSASSCSTAPSTSRGCSPPSSCGPCRSTSTTGTSSGSSHHLFDDADLVALIVAPAVRRPRRRGGRPTCRRSATSWWSTTATTVAVRRRRRGLRGGAGRGLARRATSTDAAPTTCYFAYTGGTTGMPKGVVWRHEDLFFAALGGGDPTLDKGPISDPEELPESPPRLPDGAAVRPAAHARERPLGGVQHVLRRRQGRAPQPRPFDPATRCGSAVARRAA